MEGEITLDKYNLKNFSKEGFMMRLRLNILLLIAISLMITSCSSNEETPIIFSALIYEVNDGSWLVSTSDDVGFDKASVIISPDLAIPFNPLVGQTVIIEIKPEIRESYPVQVTAISVALAEAKINIPQYTKITPEEAKAIIDSEEGFLIVDVRTEEEYKEGHIEGAILLPVDEIKVRAEKELPDLNQKILLYCRSGNRSETAAKILLDMGYTNVLDFGGIIDWPYEVVK